MQNPSGQKQRFKNQYEDNDEYGYQPHEDMDDDQQQQDDDELLAQQEDMLALKESLENRSEEECREDFL